MSRVHLIGRLVCHDDEEAQVVERLLPRHVALTRAEEGCLSFEVTRDAANRLQWRVEEWFRDAAAFRAHQARVADSEWGPSTAGIERRYTTEGLEAPGQRSEP